MSAKLDPANNDPANSPTTTTASTIMQQQQQDDDDDTQSATSLNHQQLYEYNCDIYPKIQELCQIYHYLNKSYLPYGTHISIRISPNSATLTKSPYFIIVLPQLKPYLSIKLTDLIVYSSGEQQQCLPKSLLAHKLIYDSNPRINFIIHANGTYVNAISSMKCGLLKISTESVMLNNIAYYEHSMYIPKVVDDGALEMVTTTTAANELSSKINDSRIIFFKCNGALCYGSTIEEAFHYMLNVEAAAKIQILTKCSSDGDANLLSCDPDYCDHIIQETNNNEFFNQQYFNLLCQSQIHFDMLNTKQCKHCLKYDSNNDNSCLYASSLDDFSNSAFKFNKIVYNNNSPDTGKKSNSSSHHESSKVNIPKCESTREVVLSYEFRSNITSTATNQISKVRDEPDVVRRAARRFKAKRCCSLTSGVEKAIAKKVFSSTTPNDEYQMS